MKELAVYFKKRMKDQETIPKLWADRNYGEDVEYNIDHEIENRKIKLLSSLHSIKNGLNNRNINNLPYKNDFEISNIDNNNNNNNNNLSTFENNENNGICYVKENEEAKIKDEIINNGELNNKEIPKAKLIEFELKLLKAYNFQKKLRRDVVINFINEFDKHNTVYYSDVLFHKTLLDRRFYKRQNQNVLAKKETRLNDKFEQQLRVGIDFRKRDKHLEFLNSLIQHHKDFMEFHKTKKVKISI